MLDAEPGTRCSQRSRTVAHTGNHLLWNARTSTTEKAGIVSVNVQKHVPKVLECDLEPFNRLVTGDIVHGVPFLSCFLSFPHLVSLE